MLATAGDLHNAGDHKDNDLAVLQMIGDTASRQSGRVDCGPIASHLYAGYLLTR